MARSAVLIERERKSELDNLTSSLVCTKRKEGSFSLRLCVSGGLGGLRQAVLPGIKCPRKFVTALISVTTRSGLNFEDYEIADDICTRLRELDPKFADAVADDIFRRQLEQQLTRNNPRSVAA